MSRTDTKGCNTYEARFSNSGIFMNIEVPSRSVFAKMATEESSLMEIKKYAFHEIVTQFHAVYVSFGSCKQHSQN